MVEVQGSTSLHEAMRSWVLTGSSAEMKRSLEPQPHEMPARHTEELRKDLAFAAAVGLDAVGRVDHIERVVLIGDLLQARGAKRHIKARALSLQPPRSVRDSRPAQVKAMNLARRAGHLRLHVPERGRLADSRLQQGSGTKRRKPRRHAKPLGALPAPHRSFAACHGRRGSACRERGPGHGGALP